VLEHPSRAAIAGLVALWSILVASIVFGPDIMGRPPERRDRRSSDLSWNVRDWLGTLEDEGNPEHVASCAP
jgi:hypothetical protein